MKELDGLIFNHDKFRDFTNRFSETLKKRNRAKIRFESFKAFRDDLRTKVVNEREQMRHSSRIFDLRQKGHNIITHKKKVDGKTFAEYSLQKDKANG